MGAVPFPIPPPPVTSPGAWDPVRDAPVPFPDQMPGTTAGGPTLGQIWQKIKEATGVETGVKTEPRVQTSETDCSQTSNQNDCNACKLAQGYLVPANYTIPLTQYRNYDYQLRIANRLAGPESFDYTYGGTALDRSRAAILREKNQITITEWQCAGIRFDGFWRRTCTAVEAKGHYSQFFDEKGTLRLWAALKSGKRRENIEESWIRQLSTQHGVISGFGRPSKLEWHFLERVCYMAALRLFGPLASVCRYSP